MVLCCAVFLIVQKRISPLAKNVSKETNDYCEIENEGKRRKAFEKGRVLRENSVRFYDLFVIAGINENPANITHTRECARLCAYARTQTYTHKQAHGRGGGAGTPSYNTSSSFWREHQESNSGINANVECSPFNY